MLRYLKGALFRDPRLHAIFSAIDAPFLHTPCLHAPCPHTTTPSTHTTSYFHRVLLPPPFLLYPSPSFPLPSSLPLTIPPMITHLSPYSAIQPCHVAHLYPSRRGRLFHGVPTPPPLSSFWLCGGKWYWYLLSSSTPPPNSTAMLEKKSFKKS